MPSFDIRDMPDREPRQQVPPPAGAPEPTGGVSTNPPPGPPPVALPGEPEPGSIPPPTLPPGPALPNPGNQDTNTLPPDLIGDIPPPPIPLPPGVGVAGAPGAEGSTFARPGSRGAQPFRTPAFFSQRPQRFGPGVPTLGGGDEGAGLGMEPDEVGELLRQLAAGSGRV